MGDPPVEEPPCECISEEDLPMVVINPCFHLVLLEAVPWLLRLLFPHGARAQITLEQFGVPWSRDAFISQLG